MPRQEAKRARIFKSVVRGAVRHRGAQPRQCPIPQPGPAIGATEGSAWILAEKSTLGHGIGYGWSRGGLTSVLAE